MYKSTKHSKHKEIGNNIGNASGPIVRILNGINQVLNEDGQKEEIESARNSLTSLEFTESTISLTASIQEIQTLVKDTSCLSLSSEIMEMMLDGGIDSQSAFPPRFQSISHTHDTRRKIIKHCLDLKRLIDKDNNPMLAGFLD